jgi:hypothetical protein
MVILPQKMSKQTTGRLPFFGRPLSIGADLLHLLTAETNRVAHRAIPDAAAPWHIDSARRAITGVWPASGKRRADRLASIL